jgi:hypothetical protein
VRSKLRATLYVAVICVVIAFAWVHVWSNTGYSPEQPIPFSHKLHAGDNHIPCQYCHVNPERSRYATVPALNICMNCHSVVAVNKPNIMKVTEAYNSGKPIDWIRVYKLPDLVYFNHSRHLAKGFDCSVCHGPVATMARIYQFRRLNMGDCVTCHRQNGGPTTCDTCHQ